MKDEGSLFEILFAMHRRQSLSVICVSKDGEEVREQVTGYSRLTSDESRNFRVKIRFHVETNKFSVAVDDVLPA